MPESVWNFGIFGSDRSPRSGDLVRVGVRACVWDIMLRRALKAYLKHSKESRGVLGQERDQERA